jgi:hypothetical protein
VLAVSLANRRGVRFERLPTAPEGALVGGWWQATVRAALPSTVGLAVLGGNALGFSRGLAGLCGGLLAGLAILGLVFGVLLRSEERHEGFRLYVDWGILQPRRFVGPPTPVSDTGPNAG